MKKIVSTISIFFILLSIFFLIYPSLSSFVNQLNNKGTIEEYTNIINNISKEEKNQYLDDAIEYNSCLSNQITTENVFSYNTDENYRKILNFGNGLIGSIEIPVIDVNLPIYHGISEEILEIGAAHLPNTSFPIGGESTHSAISAHTAYPAKIFFDNLSKVVEGDLFYIKIMDDTYSYKVCEINIVNPDETDKLGIVHGKDLVTLVTCYPYGINSHRLLVTGERYIENTTSNTTETILNQNNSSPVNYEYIIIISICLLLIIIILIIIIKRKRNRNE